jgi:hypothetical protein
VRWLCGGVAVPALDGSTASGLHQQGTQTVSPIATARPSPTATANRSCSEELWRSGGSVGEGVGRERGRNRVMDRAVGGCNRPAVDRLLRMPTQPRGRWVLPRFAERGIFAARESRTVCRELAILAESCRTAPRPPWMWLAAWELAPFSALSAFHTFCHHRPLCSMDMMR